jgi:predicted kinase
MNIFYMLCGLPSSGKSTFAKKLSRQYDAEILSSDKLRDELYGDISDQNHNNEVFKELCKRIKNGLKNNKNIIMDACNISYKRRKTLLEELRKFDCVKVCYVMATPYEDCLKQNKLRDRVVPDYVIKRMYLNFYIPMYQEGWDNICFEWNYNISDISFDELTNKTNISQDNSHHTLTIKDHCFRCSEIIKSSNYLLKEAAVYHDIGKVFTKQFKNAKGEPTEEAHYYNHMNVSAYDSMFYLKNNPNLTENDIIQICGYIQFHMQPFFINTEKSKKKFVNFVGQEFYDNLLILHEADCNAK